MSMRRKFRRQTEINRLRSKLERTGFPRLKMLFIVAITGGAGFLASYLMLRCCVTSMAVRYPLAIAIAYVVFLFLLWLWMRTSPEDYLDIPDLPGMPSPGGRSASAECPESPAAMPDDGGGVVSEAIDAVTGADEFAIPLAVLLVIGALLFSSLWIVYSAPTLFAELLVDGVLSASLYRRLRGLETQHWLKTAVSRTILPFVIAAAVSGVCGMVLQSYVPSAHSLGDVMRDHDRVDN